jgi:hypothetical protein
MKRRAVRGLVVSISEITARERNERENRAEQPQLSV